jgi:hypothetical protein
MAAITAARFKSREAALRFYFRASELLTPNGKPGIFSARRPPKVHQGPNIVDDLLALEACFHGMNDVQRWLLHELYGPGGFSMKPRPVAEVFAAVRRKFPKDEWTAHRIAQFKQEALKIFEAHLKRERLM